MFPNERSLVERYKGKPFVLLGVNEDPQRRSGRDAEVQGKVTWRSWWDHHPKINGRIASSWGISSMPALFLIDQKGKVREKWDGPPDEEQLEKLLDKYIHEAN